MTANEKLQQLFNNDELTEAQQDSMMDFNVYTVGDTRDILKRMLNNESKGGIPEYAIITTLYNLLKYSSDDFVICDIEYSAVSLLDDDTLEDILDA